MDRMKPWQIGLFIAAVVVLGGVLGFGLFSGDKVDLSNSITLIDVKTGDLYRVNLRGDRTVLLPARHPETREKTLFPVIKQDGEWLLVERYARGLNKIEGDLIDIANDGTVEPSSSKRTKYVAPKRDD